MNEVRYIRCKDSDDLIELMHEYEAEGYDTDFCYEKDGVEGFWLEIQKILMEVEDGNGKSE